MKLRKPRGLRPHAWAITRLVRMVLRTLAKYRVFRVTVINRDAVPRKGRVIVACNHLSPADPVFLWGAVRRNAIAMAMAELWRIPGLNLLLWLLGHIPVKRGNKKSGKRALAAATRVLSNNGLLFIYPEGKCSRDGTLLPFKPGVAHLAFATGAPIIPAGIIGSNNVRPLRSWRIHRREPVRLEFGAPIDPSTFTGPDRVEQLLTALHSAILELSTINTATI